MSNGTALATREQLNEIANYDPTSSFLYEGGGLRVSIDNEKRNGFVVKQGGEVAEELTELKVLVLSASPLNSHRQPGEKEKGKPRHADDVEWCESRDGKKNSVNGTPCNSCPASADCKWKIELSLAIPDREEEFMLTLPTASSMRFKQAVQKLGKLHARHFSQVVWHMWVTVEKSDGNVYPVVNYRIFDPQSGTEFDLNTKPQSAPKPIAPKSKPQITAEYPITIRCAEGQWQAFCDNPDFALIAGTPANPKKIADAINACGIEEINPDNIVQVGNTLKNKIAEMKANGHWAKDTAKLKAFWAAVKTHKIGEQPITEKEVHEALGVEHLADYSGTGSQALAQVKAWAEKKNAEIPF